jgi:sec-independent protein translocase protein TatC
MTEEKVQTVTEHMLELRRRIIWVLVTFGAFLILGFIYSDKIFRLIAKDAIPNVTIHALSPSDPFKVYIQIAFVSAIVFTLPVFFYHLWQFVRPGLKPRERKAVMLYLPVAFFLFLGGLLFGYYLVFPFVIQFLNQLSQEMGVKQLYGIYQYFSFMVNIVLPLAVLFELPVIVLFLTRIRLINPSLLSKARRVAYFVLVVIGTLISPPDLVTNTLIIVPLILLYEISILLSAWVYRRMEKREETSEIEQE